MTSTPESSELGSPKVSGYEEAFITISANGMRPPREVSSVAQPSFTGPSPRTHDTSQSIYHMNEIGEFASKLDQAAKGAFPNRFQSKSRYQEVRAILIQWEDDKGLGVSCELEDLSKVFRLGYGFETTTWLIPIERSLAAVMSQALTLVNEAETDNKLLIIYYAGHAIMNDARQQVWLRTGKYREGSLEWFAIQPLFLNAKADVLFLLDCCSAASAATSSHTVTGTKETIAACAFEAEAPEPGAHSFTSELIEVLDKWKCRAPFSVAMLHSELLINLRHHKPKKDMFGKVVESRRTPVYFVTTSNSKAISIEIARCLAKARDHQPEGRSRKRRRPPPKAALTEVESGSSADSPATSDSSAENALSMSSESGDYAQDQLNRVLPDGDLAIPHVLISLALEGNQLLEVGAWNKWLSECPSFANYARIEGMYKSHSTLLILSVPVVIWNLVPDHLACSFIGYIDSINYIREEAWQDNDELQSWLKRKNGGDHIFSFRAESMSPVAAKWGSYSMRPNPSLHENPISSRSSSPLEAKRVELSPMPGIFDTASNADHGSVGSIGSMNSVRSIIYWSGGSTPPDFEDIRYNVQEVDLRQFAPYATPSPPGTPLSGSSNPESQCNSGEQQEGEPQGMQISEVQLSERSVSERGQPRSTAEDHRSALQITMGLNPDPELRAHSLGQLSQLYMYSPLNVARKEIRLAVLLPGQWSDPVQVSLELEALNELPQYEVLSYCWGNMNDRNPIFVNGREYGVTRNLWDALRYRRSREFPRTMWIDAICINQKDVVERSNQVMIMRDIYQQADRVVAWLGSETEATAILLNVINRNAAHILKENELLSVLSLSKLLGAKVLETISETMSSDLLARPYWRRVWILQEIVLARNIEVVCRDSSVEWNLFIATVKLSVRYLASIQTSYQITRREMEAAKDRLLQVPDLDQLRVRHRLLMSTSQSISITELLGRLQKFQATDGRDKIFGLLGLWGQKKYMVPDYQSSVAQVYFEFARNIITKDQSLDIITLSTVRLRRSGMLPSWVPDWRIRPAYHPLNLGIQIGQDQPFSAFKLFPASISISENYRTLIVEGILFDRIKTMNRSAYFDTVNGIFNFMASTLDTAWRVGGDAYITGEDVRSSVSRTLSADLDWRKNRCRPGQSFWDILQDSYLQPPEDYRSEAPHNERLEMLRRDTLIHVLRMNDGRRFMMTNRKYMGLFPGGTEPGDLVCILFGCSVPIVLRQKYGTYTLVGECYVHGIMDGEPMMTSEFEKQTFSIV